VLVDDNRTLGNLLAAGTVDAVVTDTLELATFTAPFRVAARLSQDRKHTGSARAAKTSRGTSMNGCASASATAHCKRSATVNSAAPCGRHSRRSWRVSSTSWPGAS